MESRAITHEPGERLYTIQEVADLWSVSRDQVEKLMREGSLGWVVVGRRRRIPASELDRYVADNRTDPGLYARALAAGVLTACACGASGLAILAHVHARIG